MVIYELPLRCRKKKQVDLEQKRRQFPFILIFQGRIPTLVMELHTMLVFVEKSTARNDNPQLSLKRILFIF